MSSQGSSCLLTDCLTSSHHCGPLNDHKRVRTALRHPLLIRGSLTGKIGHLVMMSFVKTHSLLLDAVSVDEKFCNQI